MPEYSSESDLKYIDSLDNIPLSGPDDFTDTDKLEAAEFAESKLEADINLGEEITNPGHLEGKAASAWASYILVYGGEAPESALSGSIVEGGNDDLMEFAQEHKSVYREVVTSLQNADDDAKSDAFQFEVYDYGGI